MAFTLTPEEFQREWIANHSFPAGHCCLGVVCEVFTQFGGKLKRTRTKEGTIAFDGGETYMPRKVLDALGGDVAQAVLSNLNDRGVSFAEIADKLEGFGLNLGRSRA